MTVGTPDSLGTWRSWRAGVKPSTRGDGWQSEAVGRQGGLTCSAPGISPDVLGPETAGQLPRSFVCVEKLCPVNGSHSRVATGLLPPRSIPRASPGGFSPGRGCSVAEKTGRADRRRSLRAGQGRGGLPGPSGPVDGHPTSSGRLVAPHTEQQRKGGQAPEEGPCPTANGCRSSSKRTCGVDPRDHVAKNGK